MGFALGWNAQFHLSYVILIPFVFISLGWQLWKKPAFSWFGFLAGAAITYSLVIPTWIQYGLSSGNTANAISFNPENFLSFFTVLFRYLALACCELPRFIGANSADRLALLNSNWWLWPFALIASVLGFVQLGALLLGWFKVKHPQKDWPAVKTLAGLTFLLIYLSFLFAIKTPAAHTYYLTLPLVMIYGFYALSPWVAKAGFPV